MSDSSPSLRKRMVSVVIPTYNRGVAIQRTVASVLGQDIEPEALDIIIVDDGSTDDTWGVLQELYEANKQVRLFRIPNGGVANARNFGLSQAQGEFIAYLDHDDVWLPNKLRLQREPLLNHPEVGLVYCLWSAVDDDLQRMPPLFQQCEQSWWRAKEGKAFPWTIMPHALQFLRNPIVSMTIPMMRTEQIRSIGGFDPSTVPSDDWDMWIRLSQVGKFAFVPEVLAYYVFHSGQQHKNMVAAYNSWMTITDKHAVPFSQQPLLHLKQRLMLRYCRSFLQYYKAKNFLFAKKYHLMFLAMIRAVGWRPDIVITKRGLYFLYRLLTFNNKPY